MWSPAGERMCVNLTAEQISTQRAQRMQRAAEEEIQPRTTAEGLWIATSQARDVHASRFNPALRPSTPFALSAFKLTFACDFDAGA
jgi:hypothetical protein